MAGCRHGWRGCQNLPTLTPVSRAKCSRRDALKRSCSASAICGFSMPRLCSACCHSPLLHSFTGTCSASHHASEPHQHMHAVTHRSSAHLLASVACRCQSSGPPAAIGLCFTHLPAPVPQKASQQTARCDADQSAGQKCLCRTAGWTDKCTHPVKCGLSDVLSAQTNTAAQSAAHVRHRISLHKRCAAPKLLSAHVSRQGNLLRPCDCCLRMPEAWQWQ